MTHEPERLIPTATQLVRDGMARGLHLGAQLYVSIEGRTLVDGAIGWNAPGAPLRRDTLMHWLSAGKPLTAVAVAQQVARGAIHLHAPVASVIPEFAAHGKHDITPYHLLTHTGGFRSCPGLERSGLPWTDSLDLICNCRLERGWTPGATAGYHPATSWYILAELILRADGRPYWQYIREEICEPLGMTDAWLGLPPDRWQAYDAPPDGQPSRIGRAYNTRDRDHPQPPTLGTESQASCGRGAPGSGLRAPARDLARFYEALLNGGELDGRRILDSEMVEEFTHPHRTGLHDKTFRLPLDWALGFMLANRPLADSLATQSADSHSSAGRQVAGHGGHSLRHPPTLIPYGFGPAASSRAFGHGGSQCSIAFADPDTGLVISAIFNALPGEHRHQHRMHNLLTAIAEDLALL